MHDDVRPPERPRQQPLPHAPDGSPAAGSLFRPHDHAGTAPEDVDEAKIEREFGPPPDNGATSLPGTRRLGTFKLLPAITLSRLIRRRATKRELLFISLGLLIVLCGGAASYVVLHNYKPTVAKIVAPIVHPKPKPPTTVASTLTGLQVDPSINKRPVTAVMIENSPDARPQSGLDTAGVVFEAIAEGGITRFMALYQDTTADYIGPVRSSRFYYLQWALGFDAAYAHVGGSPEALQDIKSWGVKDLDQFYNAGAYERISSRYAPHNVYTSSAQLSALEQSKGYTTSNYTGFARNATATPAAQPTATSIDMTFSGYYYNTHYDYDAATNTYKRSEGGAPHMELHKDGSQVQIAPTVLVALIMPYSLEADGYHSDYQTIGSGKMYVFQGGAVQTGTWTKSGRTSQFVFTDDQGQPLKLDPGQTWISALASTGAVTYK